MSFCILVYRASDSLCRAHVQSALPVVLERGLRRKPRSEERQDGLKPNRGECVIRYNVFVAHAQNLDGGSQTCAFRN